MSRKEMLLRTRGRLLPFLFLVLFLLPMQAIIVVCGILANHGFTNVVKEGIFILAEIDAGAVALGVVLNWKYSLDILFRSTKIFSGRLVPGQRIFRSKIENSEGAQWELIEKNGNKFSRKFKIYSDRMGLAYPSSNLPADLCAGTVTFRYMKRSRYIVEIIRTEAGAV